MKFFKNLFFVFFIFSFCLSHSLFAKIIQIDNFENTKQEILQLDNDSLVLFDVDYTLIIPNDAILRPYGQRLVTQLMIEILENPSIVPPGKYLDGYLHSQVLLRAKSSLMDELSLSLVKYLQDKGIRTMALTAAPSGKLGVIESMADWRINELKQLGFNFTMAFPKTSCLTFPKRRDKEFYPLFKSGVLFSSRHPKGEVLKQFLEAIRWRPAKVVFIDDQLEYLQSVEKTMKEMGIDFIGFHYIAAEKLCGELDSKLAEFQFRYLAEWGEWISDEEARNLMERE